eukprot:TRINITY_DN8833_c0_g1_i1.p1 TRINITY_DN8833_c0_g1~~TRINITY_DN8833_c0_g1_i1.p1  ORF type:complete len:366 (-),score=106.07 TRINITY_DN8833_c0_g1_i1:422-1489(-)
MPGVAGIKAVVTGGSGFVGQRLVELLVERGAAKVVSFDVAAKPKDAINDERIVYVKGDITDYNQVLAALDGADCVWHIAALVGPFHDRSKYMAVNYHGSINVLKACRKHGIKKLVMSGSPSTRFDGNDIDGLTEAQLKYPKKYLQLYAETKALAEQEILAACCDELQTISIAPHQVYGPRDSLFLVNLLTVAGQGRLRIFGKGDNKCSFTYVDNYCHGLILGYDALRPGSPALGKFYIVTDGGYQIFWKVLDRAVVAMGFTSIWTKTKLPYLLLMVLAYICNVIGFLLRTKMRLNPFNVKMLTIHRWFNIDAATKDLGYKPLYTFDQGWDTTCEWFKTVWLPTTPYGKADQGKED